MDLPHLFAQSADCIQIPAAASVIGERIIRSDRAMGYLWDTHPLNKVICRVHLSLSPSTHELV